MMLLVIWFIIGIVLFCGCLTGKTSEAWLIFSGWALITAIPVAAGVAAGIVQKRKKAKAEEEQRLNEAYRKRRQQELLEEQRLNEAYRKRRQQELLEAQQRAKKEITTNQIELCKKYGMSVLDEMTGIEFEEFIAEVLKRIGYSISMTRASGDFGVDIVAERFEKKYAIQCKHYTAGNVGIRSVQEVYAGRTFYKADYCVVATNSRFTDAAKELAKKTDVALWDGEKLVQILKQNMIFV